MYRVTEADARVDLAALFRACALHAAVHLARSGANCIVHTHMPDEVAVRAADPFEEERDDAPVTWAAVRRRLDRGLPGYAD